jgi:peptide/nickel transport system permease protein
LTSPLDVSSSQTTAVPEAVAEVTPVREVRGRSLSQIAWLRLKRDKVALVGGMVIIFLILVAVFAPLLNRLIGENPRTFHENLINPDFGTPYGSLGGVSLDHPLGVEPINGRDLFARITEGARVSLLVAFLATALSVMIGTVAGVCAGYFGGWIDTIVSRSMDVLLAFPLLLFAIALVSVSDNASGVLGTLVGNRLVLLVLIIGFFNWPYIGRIVRGQTLSLREKEFVDAARSVGAGNGRILFRELLPNLAAPILVYSTLIIPTNIIFEASLSFLGVGVRPPTASWGDMLSTAAGGLFYLDPMFMIIPGAMIFITVLSFNLFGDGLRDALDPRAGRG